MSTDGGGDPGTARLHLHRGYGAMYTGVSAVLLCIVVAALVDNLTSGQLIMALVVGVAGLALVAYLAKVGLSLLLPSLTVDARGIRGRMGVFSQIDAGWPDVTIDVDEESPPGRFDLDFGEEKIAVYSRSWFGFRDFVLVVATTPQASRRLTPGAEQEMMRLLGIHPPPEPSPEV